MLPQNSKRTTLSFGATCCNIGWTARRFQSIFCTLDCGTLNSRLTWYVDFLDFAGKPAENDHLCPHSHTVRLNSYPYRCNMCSHIFIILPDRIPSSKIIIELPSGKLSKISLNETPAHKTLFPAASPSYICAALEWQELKLLLMHACKKLSELLCTMVWI
jgi:hypothetical protein